MALSISVSIFLQTEVVGCVGILWVFYVQILLSNLASKTRQLLNVSIFFPSPVFPKLRGKKQAQLGLVLLHSASTACASPFDGSPVG